MKPKFPGQVELLVLNPKQVKALSSVACDEVYETLGSKEPRSIREVAEEVGRSPAAVSEHMAKLVKVGLVITAGTRKRRSRTEVLYIAKAMTDRFISQENTWATIKVYLKRFQGQMRLAMREHESAQLALRKDRSFVAFLSFRNRNVYLSPENSLIVKQKFNEVSSLVAEMNEPDPEVRSAGGHVRVDVSLLMLPTVNESKKVLDKH